MNQKSISFVVKVTALHPHFDGQGIEYVCVEFSWKPPSVPNMMPVGVPEEISDIVGGMKQMIVRMPGMQQQMQKSPRLVLFLTVEEWMDLLKKYTVGDEFTISLDDSGRLVMEAE